MQWSDEGLVLGGRRHGESGVILEVMTRAHGRHLGLVQGGRSRRMQPVLQPGNTVDLTWRARLDAQLGNFQVDGQRLRTARFLASAAALHGFQAIAAHLRMLPERDPHTELFEAVNALIDHLDDAELAPILFIHFERAFLSTLGYGLDLSACAVTGGTANLTHVSPKTGRAVSAETAEPYKDRLLTLPPFLLDGGRSAKPSQDDLRAAFALTEYFLRIWVFEPRMQEVPPERMRFTSLVLKDF